MRKLFYLAFTFLILAACRKDENKMLQGTFKGTLTPPQAYAILPVEIVLKGKHFESIAGRGGGTFQVLTKNKVEFKDIHVWTADFDWNLILSGTFDYTIKGDSLIMTKDVNGSGRYQYKLEKTRN